MSDLKNRSASLTKDTNKYKKEAESIKQSDVEVTGCNGAVGRALALYARGRKLDAGMKTVAQCQCALVVLCSAIVLEGREYGHRLVQWRDR